MKIVINTLKFGLIKMRATPVNLNCGVLFLKYKFVAHNTVIGFSHGVPLIDKSITITEVSSGTSVVSGQANVETAIWRAELLISHTNDGEFEKLVKAGIEKTKLLTNK